MLPGRGGVIAARTDPAVESVRHTFLTIDGDVRRMQTRALGDTGHESSIATFGAIALNWLEQEGANQMVEYVLSKGVNHPSAICFRGCCFDSIFETKMCAGRTRS